MTPTTEPRTLEPRPRRLVIADDSAEMRWFVRAALESGFGEVVEAADGRELFWALLRSPSADEDNQVIVTDLLMPTYDGLEVLDAWRELHPRSVTVLITAFPSSAVRQRAEQLGAVVLAKPFSASSLRQLIQEASHDQRAR